MNAALVKSRVVECRDCQGEGCVDVDVPGGRFSSAAGQWYPESETVECRACRGTGEVDASEEPDSWL